MIPVPPEPPLDDTLTNVAPKFAAKVQRLLAHMEALGHDPLISESVRSDARQAWLYGFGREYDDGRGVVTQAATGDASWHKYGLAVDIISKSKQWDAPENFWADLQLCSHAEGLVSGRDWSRFPDQPHVQWGPPMRQAPSSESATLSANGGNPAVWTAVGAA